MDINVVRNQIRQRNLQNLYFFSGQEWMVQKIYIEQMAKSAQLEKRYIDNIKDIFSQLKNRSFVKKSYLYVVRDDADIVSDDKLTSTLLDILDSDILICLFTNVDKRTKFYKQNKDRFVEFEPLSDQILKKYIQKKIALSDRNCMALIDICEHDYGRILSELDKIEKYADIIGNDFDFAFQDLSKDGTIYKPPKDAIFECVDSILDRSPDSFGLVQECYDAGEATLVFLSVLYNNAKAVLQVQSCNSSDVASSTGLTGWQIRNAKMHLNKYSIGELVSMLRLIRECEKGIKTGEIEEQYVMDYILTSVL